MNLILSFDEIRILLYNLGFRQIDGILMDEKNYSGSDILQSLKHLSDNGIISAGDNVFSIREDVCDCLEIIGNPVYVERIVSRPGRPSYAVYNSPDLIVVTQLYEKKKDTLRIMTFTTTEFNRWKEVIASLDTFSVSRESLEIL